jgi:hypothetical protein
VRSGCRTESQRLSRPAARAAIELVGCGTSCDCGEAPTQLLEQALLRLDVCVIEFTSPRFLKLERQRLDPPHEPHELSSFRA